MSTRLFVLVAIAALTLGCSDAKPAAEAAADADTAPSATQPGAADGSPFSVTHTLEGTGAMPTADDVVKVHYAGRLADGTEFDSSIGRGAPVSFPLRGVIPCWTQGVAQMKVGGKATLVCPPDLAYGPAGSGVIPPNATLTFEVELLGIDSAPQ